MNVLQRSQLVWFLGVSLLTVFPHFQQLPYGLSLWFFLILSWRLPRVWYPGWLNQPGLRVLMTFVGLGLLLDFHRGRWDLYTGLALFVVALGIKLLEFNRQRDAYLVAYLCLLLLGALFLFRVDVSFAVYGGMTWLVWLAAVLGLNAASSAPAIAVFKHAVRLLLQGLPLTLVLFLLFPRIQPPDWHWVALDSAKQAESGLTDVLEPGSISRLALSPKLAFRVSFEGEMPPRNQLYWRGPVFSFTDGRRWSISDNEFAKNFQEELSFFGPAYRYRLLVEPQKHNWVYALDMPAHYDDGLYRNANYQLIGSHKAGEAAEFDIVSHTAYNTGYLTKIEYRQNRQLPEDPSPRIVELVKQLQGFDAEPDVFIQRVLAYFREQQFQYSLNPPLMEQRPVETFLFETKIGICSHYATAFVYLMRVADIPARVVTGYQGGTFNEVGRFLEVRQANAHAWAEVWLDGKGWVRVDPTTAVLPERVEQPVNVRQQIATGAVNLATQEATQNLDETMSISQFGLMIDNLDYQWQRWVVRYGSQQAFQWGMLDVGRLMQKVYVLLVGVGLLVAVWLRWTFRAKGNNEAAEVKLYRRFSAILAKAGVTQQPGEGVMAFALRAKAEKPELADWIDGVTQAFVQLRYYPVPYNAHLALLKKHFRTGTLHRLI